MISLEKQINKIYKDWYNDDFIFQKDENNNYKPIKYHEFIENGLCVASSLINKNYKNKTIILLSENSINLMIYDFAISFYVGRSVVICKEWIKDDIIEAIKEIDASLIIYSKKYENIVKDICNDINIDSMEMNLIDNNFDSSYFNLKIKDDDEIAKIVFSSGTTGKNKGVLLTIKNIFSGLNSLQKRCHLTHDDVTYMFLPLHHTYASICHFMYSLYTGHCIFLASSTLNIGSELLEVNPTIFCCVPIIINKLYDNYKDNIDKAFGKNIKYIVCGGAPLSSDIRKIFKDKGLCLMQTYALTEVSSSFTLGYPNNDDLVSAGEIYEDIDVKIYKPNNDGVGEIIVKGDNVFKGYTDKTLNKYVFDKNNYFHTGDLGYIKDNKLFVVGRKKKILLTSNGENVSADVIEEKIKQLSNNINDVKAYVKNDKIGVNIYVTCNDNYDEIINLYNNNATRYEKVLFYKIYLDSIDARLKQ